MSAAKIAKVITVSGIILGACIQSRSASAADGALAVAHPAPPARSKEVNAKGDVTQGAPPKTVKLKSITPKAAVPPVQPARDTAPTSQSVVQERSAAPAMSTQSGSAVTSTCAKTAEITELVSKFCSNVVSTAGDAHLAWQRKKSLEIEKQIEERIARLNDKIAEHKEWLAKRMAFAARASESLTKLFGRMKTEAAAQQLSEMEEETAASIIIALDPKVSAPLMAEIPPAKAAQISSILAAVSGSADKRQPSNTAGRQAQAPSPTTNEAK